MVYVPREYRLPNGLVEVFSPLLRYLVVETNEKEDEQTMIAA